MSDTTTDNMLNIEDAVAIGELLRCCQSNLPVTWLVRYPDTGELVGDGKTISGTARAIVCDDKGTHFMRQDMDVRDGYVWISSTFEHFLPVRDVLKWYKAGEFVLNYRA